MPNSTPDTMRHFMVMWSLPETFGGMTAMCLRRARNFVTVLGVPAPVLCFQLIPDTAHLTRVLSEKGHFIPGMEIRNVFAYYRSIDLSAHSYTSPVPAPPADPAPPEGPGLSTQTLLDDEDRIFARVTKTDAGAILFRECFRPDGSRYFLDISTLGGDGKPASRNIWLLVSDGSTAAHFSSATHFYHHWLDALTAGDPSAFIFDDKVAARLLRTYIRPHVVKFTPVHSNHVASGGDSHRAALDPNRELILTHQHEWDGIVFLTPGQRDDYQSRFGRTPNHFVVPNPCAQPAEKPADPRDPDRGAMVAQLRPAKNVAAAIDAIAHARAKVPNLRLDVYGEGASRAILQRQIDGLGLTDVVILHGHVPGAAEEFRTASFSLLTSKYEGAPLVLLESMARGCPPVSFDINYGPRSIISDGVDGYVVPTGDVRAMADRIVSLCRDPQTVARLSRASQKRSLDFTDEAVTAQWSRVIAIAWARREVRNAKGLSNAKLGPTTITATDNDTEITGDLTWSETPPYEMHRDLSLRLQILPATPGAAPVDKPVEVIRRMDKSVSYAVHLRPDDFPSPIPQVQLDLFLIALSNDAVARLLLKPPTAIAGPHHLVATKAGGLALVPVLDVVTDPPRKGSDTRRTASRWLNAIRMQLRTQLSSRASKNSPSFAAVSGRGCGGWTESPYPMPSAWWPGREARGPGS
jgi:poly(glycerol-phosphate) alpha-glucosyltransferase